MVLMTVIFFERESEPNWIVVFIPIFQPRLVLLQVRVLSRLRARYIDKHLNQLIISNICLYSSSSLLGLPTHLIRSYLFPLKKQQPRQKKVASNDSAHLWCFHAVAGEQSWVNHHINFDTQRSFNQCPIVLLSRDFVCF